MQLLHRLLPAVVFASVLPSVADAASGCPVPGFKYAAFGDKGVTIGGGGLVDNYDSTSGSAPFAGTCNTAAGNVGTNGTAAGDITISGGSDVCANAEVGATGSATTVVLNGAGSTVAGSGACTAASCTAQTSNTVLPSVTVPTVGTNQGAKSGTLTLTPNQTYTTVTGNNGDTITLNAGVYVIADLNMKNGSVLKVGTAPVEVYITSSMDVSGSLTNPSQKATDLVFYVASTVLTVKINSAGTTTAFGIYAPNTDITLNGSADFYGAMVGKSVKLTGGGNLHYDKAMSTFNTSAVSCNATEVSRATPIVSAIFNGSTTQTCVVQGTYELGTGTAKTVAATTDVASFVFPFVKGHMRARVSTDVTTAGNLFNDTSTAPLFDAANGIPTVVTGGTGCAKNAGRFTTSCRNVFTNTNGNATTGTTWHPTVTPFDDVDADATTIGPLLTSGLTGFALADYKALINKVVKGGSSGSAVLGGVDRSTVAVIGPSSVAGKTGSLGDTTARPAMVYFGGQDGMLHAVCAQNGGSTDKGTASATEITNYCVMGQELWAFIPRVQLPLIRLNKARIDGSVRVIDAFGDFTTSTATGTKSFRTILVFQTGYADSSSKPAVYAIDVTDPSQPTVLWEYTPPSSPASFDLGIGLAMHAGPTLVNGGISNLAVAVTSNGGSSSQLLTATSPNNAGTGVVARGLSLELGTKIWGFEYNFQPSSSGSAPRGVGIDQNTIPSTAIPGGAVGVDLAGNGFTSHVTFGDVFGNLWLLKADTGASITGSATTPIFAFSGNRHPIGALPTILDTGTSKVAAFGSGGYADTNTAGTLWSTGVQSLIGVKMTTSITSAATEGSTAGTATSAPLAFKDNATLTSGENVASQLLVVGGRLFFLTDNSNINAATYGNAGLNTGHSYSFDFSTTGSTVVALATNSGNTTRGGASGLANSGTSLYGGSADKTQQMTGAATTTTGTSVDYMGNKKPTRLVWVRAQN